MKRFHSNTKHISSLFLITATACLLLFSSCRKLIDIDAPKTEVTTDAVFESDPSANSALNGLYATMYNSNAWSQNLTVIPGMTADELTGANASVITNFSAYINNQILPTDFRTTGMWADLYKNIYNANALIEGVAGSTGMSAANKNQLTGEAKFLRALNYYYLVNLFGAVPLLTTTDVTQTASAPRSDTAAVFNLIVADLKEAQDLLRPDYSISANERVRANKSAAAAMLSKVYLQLGDHQNAEAAATGVITNSLYTLLTTANMGGINIKNNTEAIFQFTVVGSQFSNTSFLSNVFLPFLGFQAPSYALRPELLNSFSPNDQRFQKWVGRFGSGAATIFYPFKYQKNVFSVPAPATDEYHTVLRLAELYLIRAEARAKLNNVTGGLADVNTIRRRAGLTDTTVSTTASLVNLVLHERRLELFCEHGLRWIDLKRTGTIDAVLSPIKPGWQPYKRLYPIPQDDLNKNPALNQNQGY